MSDRPLPLFPLDMVLLPGSVVPLHIFEPRYRRMLGYCLEYDRRFGLVYHDPDVSGPFLNESGRVGCVAKVERVELLEDGRSLILAKGVQRFRIAREANEPNTPFFQAWINEVFDDPLEVTALIERREASLRLFYSILERVEGLPRPLPEFDLKDELSYRLAATVDTGPAWHQKLLETTDERTRLDRVDEVFRAARTKMEQDESTGEQ